MSEAQQPAESTTPRLASGDGRVLRGAALLAGATVVAKFVALAKDWLVARQLGAGDELDAYLVAFLLPSYAVVVLAHSFASAFVPTYIRVWQQVGRQQAQHLAGRVIAAGAIGLGCVTLVLVAVARYVLPLLAIGFDAAKLSLTLALFYPLAGVIVAAGLSAMVAAILNAHERFAAPAAAPIAIPLATLAVFAGYADRFGVYALAVGTTLGFVAELVIVTAAAARLGLLAMPRLSGLGGELRHVARQYLPVAIGGLLMSSALIVDQAMAASLGSGQVSILSFGSKVVAVVLTAVAASLSTVLFPRFARLIAADQRRELAATVRFYAGAIVLSSIPLVALLAIVSEPIVKLLFQGGAFTIETTAAVTRVQLWLLPQIPFYVLAMVGARVLSALDGNQIVLRIAALNLLVNVTGNYVLMQRFGVDGIAMSTSLVYVIAAAATLLAIRTKLREATEPRAPAER